MFEFLYNNEKLVVIIIIIVIIYLCLKKKGMLERFENEGNVIDTLLNSYNTTDKKFNNMVDSITLNDVIFGKNIKTNKYLNVGEGIDVGGDIVSKGEIKTSSNITATGKITASGDIKGKRLCIGGTCLNEDHLKLLTDGFKMKIEVGKQSGQFIHSHSNKRLGPHGSDPAKFKMYKY